MTVVRAKQRSHGGQLAEYLTRDPTAELGQVRGVVATSAHDAIAELSLLAAGTRARAELFHCSINPNPADAPWTDEQYRRAWKVFEREHGLTDHAFVEVYHSDEGRLHTHRVYAVVANGKAAKLSWSRIVNQKVGRILEHEFGHQVLPGPNQSTVLKWLERSGNPQQRAAAATMRAAGLTDGPRKPPTAQAWEKDQAERTAVAVGEIERATAEAWRAAGGDGTRFIAELKARTIILARGDKGPVLVDWAEGVHPAGRRLFAGLTKGEPGREMRHQAQGDAISAACPGLPSVDQARTAARRAMAPAADQAKQHHGDRNDKENQAYRARKPNSGKNRREPPPRARHSLQDLCELELVSFGQPSEVLLQRNVRNNVLDGESTRDTDVRQELRLGDHEMNTTTTTADQAVRIDQMLTLAAEHASRGEHERAVSLYREAAATLRTLGDQAAAVEDFEAAQAYYDSATETDAAADQHIYEAATTISDLSAIKDALTRFMVMDREAARIDKLAEDQAEAEGHRLAAATEIMASSRLRERAAEMGIAERVYSLAPREENKAADEARERGFDFKAAQDHESAIQHFREAAAAGDAESMHELAQYHELGVEVPQDLNEASRLYQAAADAGFMEAVNALDSLGKRRRQDQTAQPAEKAEPVERMPEPKEAWQARKAFDELNSQPADRLSAIAAGRDRGKDHRLWAWRWNHLSSEMCEALQLKIAAVGQAKTGAPTPSPAPEKRPAAPEKVAQVATSQSQQSQEFGSVGPRHAAVVSAADRAAAYRSVVGEKSAIDIQGDTVRIDLPSGQTIRDNGRSIFVDRVDAATCTTTARTLIELVKARGWTETTLRGPKEFKLAMARCAVELGIEVKNAELAADVAQFKKENENVARMRPGNEQGQRPAPNGAHAADRRDDQVAPSNAHQAIEQYAGRSLDQALTRGAEAATLSPAGGLAIQLAGGSTLTHDDGQGAELAGLLTMDHAQLMATLMAARGETSVTLSGSQHAKELMARAAVSAGLDVSNTEMHQLVEQLKRELFESRERQAQVAAMRPGAPQQEQRPPQSREASAGALKELEIGRHKLEMTSAGSAVDRMHAADRLAHATTDQALRLQAQEVRLQAARQAVAEGHHDEMAEEIVAAATPPRLQSQEQER